MIRSLIFVSVVTILGPGAAFADAGPACSQADWARIANVVKSPAANGENYRAEVQSLLTEETVPLCENLTDPNIRGIPGNQYLKYSLTSGQTKFELSIVVGGVESFGTTLYIEKK